MNITKEDENHFKNDTECWPCEQQINLLSLTEDKNGNVYWRVRGLCHLTGKYRGAAFNSFNTKAEQTEFVSVINQHLSQ